MRAVVSSSRRCACGVIGDNGDPSGGFVPSTSLVGMWGDVEEFGAEEEDETEDDDGSFTCAGSSMIFSAILSAV